MPSSKGWRDPEGERSADVIRMGDVVKGILGQRPFARGMAVGRLARAWRDVVGDRLAEETQPAKLEGGTLVVEASSGPWGSQAQFLAEEIRKRANQALGTADVQHVRVVVVPDKKGGPKGL